MSANGGAAAPSMQKNPRRAVWREVCRRIKDDPRHIYRISKDNVDELKYIEKLSNGVSNIEMVGVEWRDIYGAMFDESVFFDVADCDLKSIEKDINRTFSLFQRNYPLKFMSMNSNKGGINNHYKALETILRATTHHRTYCQGINFLAANFLMNEETPRDSFILLNYLLRQCYLEILFDAKCSSLMEYMKIFEKRLRLHNKNVYNHFKMNNFGTFCYAIEWFTTCFIVSNPGVLSACCIDLLLMGYHNILLRVGLAITDVIGKDVLLLNQEELQIEFKKLTRGVDVVSTLTRALTLKQTGKKDDVLKMMSLNIYFMNPRQELTDTMFDPTLKYDEEIITLTMIETNKNLDAEGQNLNAINSNNNKKEKIDKLVKKVVEKALSRDGRFRRQFDRESRRNLRPINFDSIIGKHVNCITPVDAGVGGAKQQSASLSSMWVGLGTSGRGNDYASHADAVNSDSDGDVETSFTIDNVHVHMYNSPPLILTTTCTSSSRALRSSKGDLYYNAIQESFLLSPSYCSGYDADIEGERGVSTSQSDDTADEDGLLAVAATIDVTRTRILEGRSGDAGRLINRTRSNSYFDTMKYRTKNRSKKKKKKKNINAINSPHTINSPHQYKICGKTVSSSFIHNGGEVDCRGIFESTPPMFSYTAWKGDVSIANPSNKYDISRY